ncbi:MAG: CHRD domain-containing protein [Saprospiraceae bacterium]|nr:CHRD domain-containing protein [Saprospiraceae bacterium]
MKNLLFFGLLLLISSCTKDDALLSKDASLDDEITFSARSQKAKKGNFRGHLSGEETQAQGQVKFTFEGDNSSVYFKLIVANMEDITGAYLYHRHMDHNHPVLTLWESVTGSSSNGVLVEGVLTDITCSCGEMDHRHTLDNLRKHIEDGETYVVVHSENGNIQGNIH